MLSLNGSRTEANLQHAFADGAQANRRYHQFAATAEAEGYRDLAAKLRARADDEARHACQHLDYLFADCDAPDNLVTAITTLTDEHIAMYAGMARTAHDEGFEDIADWFVTLAKAERAQAGRFRRALSDLR